MQLSISFGCADAALVVSKDPALADAAATALGNAVQPNGPLEECFKAIDNTGQKRVDLSGARKWERVSAVKKGARWA